MSNIKKNVHKIIFKNKFIFKIIINSRLSKKHCLFYKLKDKKLLNLFYRKKMLFNKKLKKRK